MRKIRTACVTQNAQVLLLAHECASSHTLGISQLGPHVQKEDLSRGLHQSLPEYEGNVIRKPCGPMLCLQHDFCVLQAGGINHLSTVPLLDSTVDVFDALQPAPVSHMVDAADVTNPGSSHLLKVQLHLQAKHPLPGAHAFLLFLLTAGRREPLQPELFQTWLQGGQRPPNTTMHANPQHYGLGAAGLIKDATVQGVARHGAKFTQLSVAVVRMLASSSTDQTHGEPAGMPLFEGREAHLCPPAHDHNSAEACDTSVINKLHNAAATYEVTITSTSMSMAAAAHAGILRRVQWLQQGAGGLGDQVESIASRAGLVGNYAATHHSNVAVEGMLQEARNLRRVVLALQVCTPALHPLHKGERHIKVSGFSSTYIVASSHKGLSLDGVGP